LDREQQWARLELRIPAQLEFADIRGTSNIDLR
jgi:hypothetical protein